MPVADPESLGPYRIVRRVGVGGMGVVYEAIHTGLDKRVALKVLPRELAANRLERFLREARTAAALHHTNIVPVFDVGQVDGVPYYAMQFIDGQPLGRVAEPGTRNEEPPNANPTRSYTPEPEGTRTFAGPITAVDRAPTRGEDELPRSDKPGGLRASHGKEIWQIVALVLQAAEGLAHAHARGIVHRDVKPSNLLLDGSGVVWVADFGLAFRADDPTLTTEGAILGTPRYMSPEQAQAQKTDARSDVYSLGVTLYELLTGRAAFVGDTPLSVIQNVIANTPPSPRALNRDVPRDLETVVLKAMAKPPDDRYPTARELADDLARFLAGEPVRARRISVFGRAWRWAKRNPAVASLLAAVLFVFATGTVVSAYFAGEARIQERESTRAAALAERNAEIAIDKSKEAWDERNKMLATERANHRLVYAARISLAGVALRENDHVRVGELLRETFPKPGETDPRGWEWHYLFRTAFSESRVAYVPMLDSANAADAERMVLVHADGMKRVEAFSIPAKKPLFAHDTPADMQAAGLSPRYPASSGGKRLVYRTNQHLVVWEPEGGKELLRLPLAGHRDSSPPALNAAGTRLARFAPEGENDEPPAFEVWNLETGKRLAALVPPKRFGSTFSHRAARLSDDGRWLAVLIDERRCVVWDVAAGTIRLDRLLPAAARDIQAVAAGPANPGVAFSPDGRLLVVRGPGGERVEVFDLLADGGVPSDSLSGFSGHADAIAVSPDGKSLAVADSAGIIAVYDLVERTPPQVFRTTYRNLLALRFSPDGRGLVAHSFSNVLEWDLSRPSADSLTGLPPRAAAIEGGAIQPGGRAVALSGAWSFHKSASMAGVALWDPASRGSRSLTPSIVGMSEPLRSISWSANGRLVALVAALRDGPYDVATRFRFAPPLMHPLSVALLAKLALDRPSASVVLVIEAETSRIVQSIHAPVSRPPEARLSPCGRWVAIHTGDGYVVHTVSDGRRVCSLREPGRYPTGAFTADVNRFVMTRAGNRNGLEADAIVWDLTAGTEDRFACPGGYNPLDIPLLSPDGRWVAVIARAEQGFKLVVRETTTGAHAVVAELTGTHAGVARDPGFSPDGQWVIVPSGPRECDLYATGSWQRKLTLTGINRGQPELIFAADGRRVFELHSGLNGQTLKVLDAESGQEVLAFTCSARQPVRSALPAYFDGNRLVIVRQWVPAGTTEIETFDGTPVPEEVARGRLHLAPGSPGVLEKIPGKPRAK